MPEDTTLQLHIATLYITISLNNHNLSPTLPHHIYQIPTSYITYRISLHYHIISHHITTLCETVSLHNHI